MSCELEITSEKPFMAGSTLEGSVVCTFSKPTTVTDSDTELPKGISRYPFEISIPLKLPPSLKIPCFGRIEYELKARVKRHFRFDMTEEENIELVAEAIDLNKFPPELRSESSYSTHRNVTDLCGLLRGRITLNAVISKRLFLLGETITLDIDIANLSGLTIKKVFSRLLVIFTIYFTEPHLSEEVLECAGVRSPGFPGVKKYEEKSFSLYLDITDDNKEADGLANLKYSRLFKTAYHVQVIAKLSGYHSKMVLQFEIFLGDIPLSKLPLKYEPDEPFIRGSSTSSSSSIK